MFKKMLFWGVAVVVVTVCLMTPGLVESSVPTAYYVTPNIKAQENIVNCTGTIQPQSVSEIFVDSPLVAKQVLVEVGDLVNHGDLLVVVNEERTRGLTLQPEEMLQAIIEQETTVADSAAAIDWQGLASLYGLNAVPTAADVDYTGVLQDVLSNATGAPAALTTTSVVNGTGNENIYAPSSGLVTNVSIQSNVPVSAGKTVITIADTSAYKVMATVGEADISRISVGDRATVRGVGFNGNTYQGEVTKIYPTARKILSGTSTETVVDVEIALEDGDEDLKVGFTAKVEISGGENRDMLTVPYETIRQDENNDEYVYEFQDGKLRKTLVMTGQEMTNEVEILSGISINSVVVYNPGDDVKEGGIIQIKGKADVS